jgi:endonuclease-3
VTPAKRRAIFERLRAGNPNPTTELEHATPFELLVAVVLSAQSTDKGVNKVTKTLFPVANTPAGIAALGVEALSRYIGSLGLFRNKAKNVVALSQRLVAEHGGQVPSTREALERLPGVGRKTANVVLNVAFGQPTIAVDTHIFRVANRTGLANGRDVVEVEQQLEATVPDEYRMNAHHWLILHGRYVCVARTPRCPECVIRELCEYTAKTGEVLATAPKAVDASRGKPPSPRALRTTRKIESATAPLTRSAPRSARGVQPMAKTARAVARKGRSR